jgi:predicted  nucleic acid-binding Zn-ribbon protein
MSIMEKYQSLNRGIDDARRDTAALQDETEDYQAQLEALQDACRTMEQDELVVAQEESVALQSRIQDIRTARTDAAPGSSDAATTTTTVGDASTTTSTPCDYAYQKRRVDFLKDYIAQQRHDFCEESRDFRLNMKRIKLSESSSSAFLDTSVSRAFLQSNGVHVANDDDGDDGDDDDVLENDTDEPSLSLEVLEDEWHEEAMASSSPSAIATTTIIHNTNDSDDNVDTTAETASTYKAVFLARRTTEHDYNTCMAARVQAEERATKRQQKLATLQSNLDRARAAISSLTHELTETHDHTTELQAMAESFQQRATQQQKQAALGATTAAGTSGGSKNRNIGGSSNPGRQSTATSQPAAFITTRRSHTTNPYANKNNGSSNRTAVQRQHPHLAGRIRMDRQFGGASMSGLDVIGGAEVLVGVNSDDDESESDDDIGDFVAFPRRS